ncbi:major facilitator superfamily domain-containing protein, partial [Ochromonadaceae sp. CCMP2298]
MSLKYDAVETDEGGNRAATSTAADQEAKTDSTASSPAPQWSTSLLIVGFVVFLGGCSRGILFPVLWALCHELGGGVLSLGYVVAAFSIGRLVVTVPLGYFCDRYRHRRSLLIASTVLCCGALLWANVFLLGHLYWLLAAQLALGIGSGSLGVTRSFVAEQMPPSQRTETMGLMFALQYAGFTVSPIVGSVLSTMGKKIVYADTGAPSMIRSTEGTNATFTEFDDIIENTVVELSESKSFRYWEFALPA